MYLHSEAVVFICALREIAWIEFSSTCFKLLGLIISNIVSKKINHMTSSSISQASNPYAMNLCMRATARTIDEMSSRNLNTRAQIRRKSFFGYAAIQNNNPPRGIHHTIKNFNTKVRWSASSIQLTSWLIRVYTYGLDVVRWYLFCFFILTKKLMKTLNNKRVRVLTLKCPRSWIHENVETSELWSIDDEPYGSRPHR